MIRCVARVICCVAVVLMAPFAFAHKLAPSLLEMHQEGAAGDFAV